MNLGVCKTCYKEYDKDAFGAGYKYCTKWCKHTQNGTVSMAPRYKGRKRRFPRVPYYEMFAILKQLGIWGLKVTAKIPIREAIPRVYNVRVGMRQIPVVIGGATKEYSRAHVAIWYEHGHMRFLSTCTKTRNLVAVADGLKTKMMVKLTPCFNHECMRCMSAQLLRETAMKVEKHYDIAKDYVD